MRWGCELNVRGPGGAADAQNGDITVQVHSAGFSL